MKFLRPLALASMALACLLSATNAFAQACADVSSEWRDNEGGSWSVTQDSHGNLTGIYGAAPGGTCTQGQQYFITSGHYTGNGGFTVTATQAGTVSGGPPNPNCAAWVIETGTMQGPACSTAQVSWTNGTFGGSDTWSTPCKVPGETTPAFQTWLPFSDTYPETTAASFHMDITGGETPSYGWGGHTLVETFPSPSDDSCTWVFSAIPHVANGYPSSAFALRDVIPASYTDNVGANSSVVNYYRKTGRTPCGFNLYQTMNVVCPAGNQPYLQNNVLRIDLGPSTIGSKRGPAPEATKTWGTPASAYSTITTIIEIILGRP